VELGIWTSGLSDMVTSFSETLFAFKIVIAVD
jgi:hypothetical protein